MSPLCDLDLQYSNPIFLRDTLAHDDSPHAKLGYQRLNQFRKYHPDKYSLRFWTITVTMTLNTAIFYKTLHHTKSSHKRSKHKKVQMNAYLTRTHSMHIFGEIHFIKPQNDTWTTDKRLKTMKNERKRLILFWLSFHSLFLSDNKYIATAGPLSGRLCARACINRTYVRYVCTVCMYVCISWVRLEVTMPGWGIIESKN